MATCLIHLTSHSVLQAADCYEYMQICQNIFELLECIFMSVNVTQAGELSG